MSASGSKIDAQEIERALNLLADPEGIVEIRVLKATCSGDRFPRTWSGYFDPTHFTEVAKGIEPLIATGKYLILNSPDPALLARCANRIRALGNDEPTTNNGDVVIRRWLPLDFDPERRKGISSTNAEHEAALALARLVREALRSEGWPEPIFADSGNGAHLLYRIDLPADDGGLVERVLDALAARFNTDEVKLDTSVHNAGRIWKLYGTMARKGDSTPDRPHRMSKMVEVPETVSVVSKELLDRIAGPQAKPTAKSGSHSQTGGQSANDEAETLTRDEVERTLSAFSAIAQHRFEDRKLWLDLGFSLFEKSRGADWGLKAWIERSRGASNFKEGECETIWKGMKFGGGIGPGTLFFYAKEDGWKPPKRKRKKKPRGAAGNCAKECEALDCPTFDENDNPIPLGVALAIRRQRPTIVSVRGDLFDFTGKVYEPIKPVVIDGDALDIIGGCARRANLADIRHLLTVSVQQPDDYFECAEPKVLQVQNGALCIETLDLLTHDPKYRALNLFPVVFDPKAECPRFKQALEEWLPGDAGAQDFLTEFMGYCLIPDVSQEVLPFLVGEGGNGKGRYIRVVESLLGKRNVSGVPLAALRADRTFPTAALVGKLLNICPESELNKDLDEGWIKSVVSGDALEVERKGRDPFTFHNKARFIVQSNNPPHINDKSNAVWRRIVVIRFGQTFDPSRIDTSLDAKLEVELPGILNLALRGLHRLAARGRFNQTAQMQEELRGYKRECNPLATWREDRLVGAEPDYLGRSQWVSCSDAYSDYREWCKINGHTPYARAKFTRELKRLGLEQGVFRDDAGKASKGFAGVKLDV